MKRSILMVRLTSKHTGTIRKFNGREWVSAAYFKDMVANNVLNPSAYNVEYKRVEAQ